jgi:nicotinamidase-related amidase
MSSTKGGKSKSKSGVALVLVDFINTLDFSDAAPMIPAAVKAARRTARLKAKARAQQIPVIYANDHFGDWRSEFSAVVRRCEGSPGAELARLLRPEAEDHSILKPRHSAFYGTPLEFLLDDLEIDSLILTGLAADICVLFTAHDAYVRQYHLWVPADCVASPKDIDRKNALHHMAEVLKADIRNSTALGPRTSLAGIFASSRKARRASA